MRWVPRLTRGIGLGVRHELLQVFYVGFGDTHITTLVARGVAGLTAVEMALAGLALQKLAGLGELDPLGDGLGSFLLHMDNVSLCVRQSP